MLIDTLKFKRLLLIVLIDELRIPYSQSSWNNCLLQSNLKVRWVSVLLIRIHLINNDLLPFLKGTLQSARGKRDVAG